MSASDDKSTRFLAAFLAAAALALLLFAGLLVAYWVWIAARWQIPGDLWAPGESNYVSRWRYDLARMYLDPIILFVVPSLLLAKASLCLHKRRLLDFVLAGDGVFLVAYVWLIRPPFD